MVVKLNIRAKLFGGFMVVIVLLLVVFAISWRSLNNLNAATDRIVHEALPEDEEIRDLLFQLAIQTEKYVEFALTLDERDLKEARAKTPIIIAEAAQLEQQLAGEPELLAALTQFEVEYDEFLLEAERFAAFYAEGDTVKGLESLRVMEAEEDHMEAVLASLVNEIELGIEESFLEAERAHAAAVQLMIVVSSIAMIVAFSIAFFLSQNISHGLSTVARALRQIAIGDISAEVNIKSKDEIGDMAQSYREMQAYLQDVSGALAAVGKGEIGIKASLKSDKDVLGNALSQMIINMKTLGETERRFATILDIADDAIISMDENQTITLFNQGAEKAFGYYADEVIGESLEMLLPMRSVDILDNHMIELEAREA